MLGVRTGGIGVLVGVPDAEATTQFSKPFPFSFVAKRLGFDVKLVSEVQVADRLLLACGIVATSSATYIYYRHFIYE